MDSESNTLRTRVAIAGGGPAGMVLAIELGRRGVTIGTSHTSGGDRGQRLHLIEHRFADRCHTAKNPTDYSAQRLLHDVVIGNQAVGCIVGHTRIGGLGAR